MKKRWENKHIEFIKQTAGLLTGEAYKQFCEVFPDFPTTYKAFAKKKSNYGFCKAESKKLKWTAEMLEAVKQTAGQDRETAYKVFCEKFTGITATAFYNQRSRSKVSPKKPHGSNKRMTDLNEIPKAKKHYPRCLRFVLKGVWFDKIKSGKKRIEYREVKPYWDKRIRNLYHFNNTPDFNKCIFTRGYTSGDLPDSEKETIALCMFNSLNWIKEGITILQEEK